MNRVMIFMSYRVGSKTLLNLLGASKKLYSTNVSEKETILEKTFRGNFTAATNPQDICPVIYRRDGADINYISDILQSQYTHAIYWTRLENEIHSSFELPSLLKLKGDWKFVVITRDGRNQIESWMNFRGQRKPKSVEGDKPFIDMCNGWQRRAAHTKSIVENFECKLVKFEDLVINPYSCFDNIMKFIGLESDQFYLNAIDGIIKSEKTENKDNWKNWDKDKLDTFYNITDEEMKYLNYI